MTCTTATTLSARQRYQQGPAPRGQSHKQVEPPASQPNMPDTAAAPAPAMDVKPSGDLSGIAVPPAG